jgi:spore germination cell wall hydrolase CwlJ-like protein
MRVDELFPPEVIDEDIRKWMGGAMAAGMLAGAPLSVQDNNAHLNHNPVSHIVPNAAQEAAQDVSVLAKTMWAEARSHGEKGMLAVGYVVKNRAKDAENAKIFGQGIKGVAFKGFSCWKSAVNKDRMQVMQQIDNIMKTKQPPDGESFDAWLQKFKNSRQFNDYTAWHEAFNLAQAILSGQVKDPTKGATFYHTSDIHPSWAAKLQRVGMIGDHVFYRIPSPSSKKI